MEEIINKPIRIENKIFNRKFLLVILVSCLTGISILALSNNFAPALILAGFIGLLVLILLLFKPILALLFALFVIFLPIGLIPIEIQSLLNRGATIAAICLWIIDTIANRRPLRIHPSTIFMILFIIWSSITLAWASNFNEGITILQTYILRLLLFLVLMSNVIRSKKDLDELMGTLSIIGWMMVIVSLGVLFFQGYTPGTRFKVFNVNENAYGLILLFTTPGVLWKNLDQKNGFLKNFFPGLFILLAVGFIGLSGSRGSALSYVVMLILFLFWKPTKNWGALGIIFIVIGLLMLPFIFSTTLTRFIGTPGETLLGGREIIWPAGWQLIKENFLFGIGIGNSPFEITHYLVNLGARWISEYANPFHNPILVIWAETGLLGLILYLGVLFSSVFSFTFSYFTYIKNSNQQLLKYYALFTSMIIGYLISWIKGGGMESDFSYFLVLAFLIIPSFQKFNEISET